MKSFNEFAAAIVQEHSGGMKFLEFLTNIHVWRGNIIELAEDKTPDPDKIEALLRKHPTIKILTYSWHMGAGAIREKMFVYTP